MSSSQPLCLHVLVISASGLAKKDVFGMSDPYVRVSLKRAQRVVASQQSQRMKKTLNPQWNEMFTFDNVSLSQDSLLLEVYDANRLTRDNFLGKLHFKLQQIPIEMKKVDLKQYGSAVTYPLKPRSTKSRVNGTLQLKFLYFNDPPQRGSPGMGQHNLAQLVPGATGSISGRGSPSQSSTGSSGRGSRPQSGVPRPHSTSDPRNSSPVPSPSSNRMSASGGDWVMVDPDEVPPLPEGWEERQDANGRVFFIDHSNRRTQWTRPTAPASQGERAVQADLERRRQMAQTLARRNPALEASTSMSMSISTDERRGSQPSTSMLTHGMSAVSLTNDRRSSPLPPRVPPRSTSQGVLTTSLPVPVPAHTPPTSPAAVTDELPPGWERRMSTNGRPFYIDHNTRRTHWEAPPRPTPGSTSSPSTPANGPSTPTSRGSPVTDLGPMLAGWEKRTNADGRSFFIDHATRSTQWEDPRLLKLKKQTSAAVPYSRDYKAKYEGFRKSLLQRKPADLPRMFEIPVRRNHIFEDSHRAIMSVRNRDHMKSRLWVKFEGEQGLDYGGVSREWFFLLSHEIFNPYYGLFEYAASDNYTLQVNPDSGMCNENHMDYFRFTGRIMALAIYHQRLIDAFFISPFYKMLLGKRLTLHDMESVDTEFYNSIKYILENDPEPLCLTFTANREFLGQIEEVDLKPNGGDIDVTESNRKEYINLLMKWRFENRISKQMDAIKKGFNDVLPLRMLQIFDEREMEVLLCGVSEINVEDWKKNTVYSAGYSKDDDTIVWFWKAVDTFDSEMRARLLQFATGTSKVPMNGFAELQGSNGPQKFCVKKLGDPASLPRAHTCFNRIDLPPYRSFHELKERLRLAIENTEGFEGVD